MSCGVHWRVSKSEAEVVHVTRVLDPEAEAYRGLRYFRSGRVQNTSERATRWSKNEKVARTSGMKERWK